MTAFRLAQAITLERPLREIDINLSDFIQRASARSKSFSEKCRRWKPAFPKVAPELLRWVNCLLAGSIPFVSAIETRSGVRLRSTREANSHEARNDTPSRARSGRPTRRV